jgi:hypothetical protein
MTDDEAFELYRSLQETARRIREPAEFSEFCAGLIRCLDAGYGMPRTPSQLVRNIENLVSEWSESDFVLFGRLPNAEDLQLLAVILISAAADD